MPSGAFRKAVALGESVENALGHVRLGLELVGSDSLHTDRPAPVLSLLCFGSEHLLKATLVASLTNRTRERPRHDDIKSFGHKINALNLRLVDEMGEIRQSHLKPGIVDSSKAIRWIEEDRLWIGENQDLTAILDVLTRFATGRYFDIDLILDRESGASDARAEWTRLIDRLWKEQNPTFISDLDEASRVGDHERSNDLMRSYAQDSPGVVRFPLARYFKAIARLWWSGAVGEDARRWSSTMQPLVTAHDADLTRPPSEWWHG